MEETIKLVGNYGIMIVLSALFVWQSIRNNFVIAQQTEVLRQNVEVFQKLEAAIQNLMAESEGIKREQLDQNEAVQAIFARLQEHDDRSEKILTNTLLLKELLAAGFAQQSLKDEMTNAKLDTCILLFFDKKTLDAVREKANGPKKGGK